MTTREIELRSTIAPSLFDGGWREEDAETMKDCYGFSDDEIRIILEEFSKMV